jgi:hypothetical protein
MARYGGRIVPGTAYQKNRIKRRKEGDGVPAAPSDGGGGAGLLGSSGAASQHRSVERRRRWDLGAMLRPRERASKHFTPNVNGPPAQCEVMAAKSSKNHGKMAKKNNQVK